MRRLSKFVAFSTLSAVLSTGVLIAQDQDDRRDNYHDQYHDNGEHRGWNDHDHDHYIRHDDWHRGYRMPPDYWEHARRVDNWRAYHLRRPPRGYEWREVDGNYVMAAVATGVIASVIAASAAH